MARAGDRAHDGKPRRPLDIARRDREIPADDAGLQMRRHPVEHLATAPTNCVGD